LVQDDDPLIREVGAQLINDVPGSPGERWPCSWVCSVTTTTRSC
jgi:hypothetical protein